MKKGQFKTFHDATVTKAQHKTPCADCPFARIALKGWIPVETPEEWLLYAHGDGHIECHTKKTAEDDPWQCAGSAIFRTHAHKSPRDKSVLVLPANKKLVFSTNQEFYDHHKKLVFPTRKP